MTALLDLANVSKRFGSTQALDSVSFELRPGEVHALVGENGAGKSTALGLMYGVVRPDAGEVRLHGRPAALASPAAAQGLGVGCVFQELSLAGGLSVAENIFAGRAPTRFGAINWPAMRRAARALLAEFDLDLDVDSQVARLPAGVRQIVEIAKALSLDSCILLLDEPTSALTPDEVKALFALIRKLTGQGIGIVYVSHHMSEIFRIADRVTVLRDGRRVSTRPTAETSESRVVGEMVGGALDGAMPRRAAIRAAPVLVARGLTRTGRFDEVDLTLHSGEILGFAGLMGSRAQDIARALVGLERVERGEIEIDGKSFAPRGLLDAMRAGLAYLPDERKTDGLFLDFSITDNVTVATLGRHARWGILRRSSAKRAAKDAIERFAVKSPGAGTAVGALSGGNQQKVMLAKWLETRPRVLVVNEPTKGIDVGAKQHIHRELRRCAEAGMAILIVSSDFPELLAVADRIMVVREGRITGEVAAGSATEDQLIALAAGAASARARLERRESA
jgi:ribose transport system ATP-binding protein